jgi:hypothetical protein
MEQLLNKNYDFVIFADQKSLDRISKKIAFSCAKITLVEDNFLHIKTVFNFNEILDNLNDENCKIQMVGEKTGIAIDAPCLN